MYFLWEKEVLKGLKGVWRKWREVREGLDETSQILVQKLGDEVLQSFDVFLVRYLEYLLASFDWVSFILVE